MARAAPRRRYEIANRPFRATKNGIEPRGLRVQRSKLPLRCSRHAQFKSNSPLLSYTKARISMRPVPGGALISPLAGRCGAAWLFPTAETCARAKRAVSKRNLARARGSRTPFVSRPSAHTPPASRTAAACRSGGCLGNGDAAHRWRRSATGWLASGWRHAVAPGGWTTACPEERVVARRRRRSALRLRRCALRCSSATVAAAVVWPGRARRPAAGPLVPPS